MKLEDRIRSLSQGLLLSQCVISKTQSYLTVIIGRDCLRQGNMRILSLIPPHGPPAGEACGEGYYFQMPVINVLKIDVSSHRFVCQSTAPNLKNTLARRDVNLTGSPAACCPNEKEELYSDLTSVKINHIARWHRFNSTHLFKSVIPSRSPNYAEERHAVTHLHFREQKV